MSIESVVFGVFDLSEQQAIDAITTAGFVARVVKQEWLYCEVIMTYDDDHKLEPIYNANRINLYILNGKVDRCSVG